MDNLIGNAWKFTSLGDFARIEFGVTYSAGKPVEYFVRDNGGGFDMRYAARLFGAFQRLHLEEEFPGTGIGLATVQRIIHRHGGRIRAESSVGQGATFFFDLGGVQDAPASYKVLPPRPTKPRASSFINFSTANTFGDSRVDLPDRSIKRPLQPKRGHERPASGRSPEGPGLLFRSHAATKGSARSTQSG